MAVMYSFQNPICTAVSFSLFSFIFVFYCLLPRSFLRCVEGRYDTMNSHLTQIFTYVTVNSEPMLLHFFLTVSKCQLSSKPSVTTFVTCPHVLMYVRSLSLHTTLYRYFVNQASEEKLAVHIGFVNLYMELPLIAVFQISWEKQKMTIHIGFVNSLHKK